MKNKRKKLYLTKAEEEVMQILWNMKKAFVRDMMKTFGNPKPAYTTVSTIVRILEKKGFVGHNEFGNSHEYYPIIQKDEYRKYSLKTMMDNYFDGSFRQLASFLVSNEDLDIRELEEILEILKKKEPPKN